MRYLSGLAVHGGLGRSRRIEPIAKLQARVPQARIREALLHGAQMHPHGGVLRGKRVLVAVDLPERPGHPAARVAPKRQLAHRLPEVVAVLDHVGRHHGYAGKRVVRGLGHEGLEPVAQKRRAVVLETPPWGRTPRCRPSSPCARRAAGSRWECSQKFIALTPERVRNELVHVIIRACEPARARQVGADGHGLDYRPRQARPANP